MKLRLANDVDLPVLAEMNFQLIKDEGHSNPMSTFELRKRMEDWLRGIYTAAIIEDGADMAGYALWRIESQYIYIRQFFVKSEYRRMRIGTAAIQQLKQQYWKGHLLRLEVLVGNQRGLAFWKSLGFNEYCRTMECKNA